VLELVEMAWFDVISTGAELIGSANVVRVGGGGKNDGGDDAASFKLKMCDHVRLAIFKFQAHQEMSFAQWSPAPGC